MGTMGNDNCERKIPAVPLLANQQHQSLALKQLIAQHALGPHAKRAAAKNKVHAVIFTLNTSTTVTVLVFNKPAVSCT